MRRTSVSLPTKNIARDPYEKPARYRNHNQTPSILDSFTTSVMQGQRSRWLKATAILVFITFLFYYISPKGVDLSSGGGSHGGGQVPVDSSYGTDKCKQSSSPSKPIVQYVVMIDAGSSGSRVHVYKFNNCGDTPEVESEFFKMTEKEVGGLSKYKDNPQAAAESLDPLLEEAVKNVPDALKRCTPIAVKATAGLRMVGAEAADKILEAVRNHLETKYPFPVVSKENKGVAIMDGSDEGVYAWITVNYLLGKIGGPDATETAATFDLGGGSTQIVFEPSFKGMKSGGMPEKLQKGDHKYDLDFGGHKFELYQHSHLGYGLMAARETIHKNLLLDIYSAKKTTEFLNAPVINPCIIPGMSKMVKDIKFEDGPLAGTWSVNMTGPSVPAPALCRAMAEKMLKKDAECALAPCSFNGVHQPLLSKTFATEDAYVFSFFYDRTKVLGMPDSFTIRELHELTSTVCGGEEHWDIFSSIPEALEDLRDGPDHCLDLNFMVALLHTGYSMPLEREVKIAKKIKDFEMGWCLGASLPLLEPKSGWECKISEVH